MLPGETRSIARRAVGGTALTLDWMSTAPNLYCSPSSIVKVMTKPFWPGSYSAVADDDAHVRDSRS